MRVVPLVFLLAALADVRASVQEPVFRPYGDDLVFHSSVDLVALNVSVTDPRRQFVANLARENFEVFENGQKRDVLFFAAGRVPVDVAIAIDTSSSMGSRLEGAQQAAIGLVEALHPGDRISVIAFGERASVVQPLGADMRGAIRAIRRTRARGSTALYDALYVAMRHLAAARSRATVARRPAIVLLSDGEDTASFVGYEDVLELAKESDIAVYTIAFLQHFDARSSKPAAKTGAQPRYAMRALGHETGGRAFVPIAVEELAPIYGSVADELAHQYTLAYSPVDAGGDGAFRRVLVRVVDRPGAVVRTRTGYKASVSRAR